MEKMKGISRQIAFRVILFFLLAFLVVDGGAYWLLYLLSAKTRLLMEVQPPIPPIAGMGQFVVMLQNGYWPFFVPASAAFFFLLGLFQWLWLRRLYRRRLAAAAPTRQSAAPKARKTEEARKAEEARLAEEARKETDQRQRLFLHLLAVLQREGRLLDFFSENLTAYADGQIGAAVRTIHENCKRAVDKYLGPQPILEQQEGAQITVEQDFDPNAMKLVGNVTGRPPFTGIVRHRGWKARKLELPTLSGQQDPGIIAPAEIEVQ